MPLYLKEDSVSKPRFTRSIADDEDSDELYEPADQQQFGRATRSNYWQRFNRADQGHLLR